MGLYTLHASSVTPLSSQRPPSQRQLSGSNGVSPMLQRPRPYKFTVTFAETRLVPAGYYATSSGRAPLTVRAAAVTAPKRWLGPAQEEISSGLLA